MNEVKVFLSSEIAPANRLAAFSEMVQSTLTKMDVGQNGDNPINAKINSIQLPNTTLASFDLSPIKFNRSKAHVKDGDDRFSLVACTGGSYEIVTPDDRTVTVYPGMAGLVSHRLPSKTFAYVRNCEKTLIFPREYLNQALRDPDEKIGVVPEGGMVAVRLIASYLGSLLEEPRPIATKLQHMIEGHALDLLAHAYDPTGEWAHAEPNGGVRAARLQALLTHISINFFDPHLSAESLATEHGMSKRQVHYLMAETGRTLSEHILEHRLQAARQILQNPRKSTLRVSEIAYETGFTDISYFNRCFKRRFGDTPTGYRTETGLHGRP